MINYIVYNNEGEILRTGTCSANDMHLQGGPDEHVMEGIANDVTQKIFDGNIVDKNETPAPREQLLSECMESLRFLRNKRLASSDWTQVADSPLTESKKAEWATYRQALRNLPSQHLETTDIASVAWPSRPTS